MGTQCWEAEENPWCEAVDVLGSRSRLLSLSQGWAGALVLPASSAVPDPTAARVLGPPGLYHPWVRFGAACVP